MVDLEAEIRAYLVTKATLTTLTGTRIYADANLPATYKPSDGGALLFTIRGGPQDYTGKVPRPSLQFRSYGMTAAIARQVDRALNDVLNDKQFGKVKWVRQTVLGQPLKDPETNWDFVLSFYEAQIGNF